MVDVDTLKTLGTALGGIKAITDIAATITNAKLRQEMNGKIADLQGTLLMARQQMLEMQEKYEQVLQENKKLKEAAATPKAKPRMKWGCYEFEGEDGLFCTACYDMKGQKIQTTRININFRQCPACKAMLGAG
jgi:TolA-binding protein